MRRISEQESWFGMLSELKTGKIYVGLKQVRRGLEDASVRKVFIALDAEPRITDPIRTQCRESSVETEDVPSMKELGAACGIEVGAAVAAILR